MKRLVLLMLIVLLLPGCVTLTLKMELDEQAIARWWANRYGVDDGTD